ncbi:TPA: hypothetical protein ACIK0N_000568 [Campylobacter jejuni]|uniref:hypothetical protein n=1 Tax=Campylobacter TaxID=194 RepID=UPI000258887F|nr:MULTISPECIES: hypothetical protein [Campylobacter]EIB90356.1 hypothetical protein cje96_05720 [Campylobacter jejuni subsp. jejuni LMG 23211]EKY4295332.1 hypothetical protein [Campylobacter jejuni]ELO8678462.1 hypothetical protein [Campylobacter jejuni]KJD27338.1 hypothetical protein TM44_03370 [Campylobacter jejuni subsp. jejuni]KJD29463.1 hypothetical protein TM43_01520 [Campylobacter jejuni subsp. jejuni]
MSKDCLQTEIYIIEGQEYIFDNKSQLGAYANTLTYNMLLFQNGIPYKITFRTFQNNKDKYDEFEKQTKYRNYPLHILEYATIRENEVKIIDENPFVKVEITYLDRLTKNKKIESMNITRFVIFSIEEIAKVLSGSKQMK